MNLMNYNHKIEFIKKNSADLSSNQITQLINITTAGMSFELIRKAYHDTFQMAYFEI